MSPRQHPWLWGSGILLFSALTICFFLRCVPCPPEAHGWAGPHGCMPCWQEMTPAEWVSFKLRYGR